jgi:predicted RNase H-like nuclease
MKTGQLEPERRLLGVDGCKSGWVACFQGSGGLRCVVYGSAQELIRANLAASVIAVDVPIGLTDEGPREADRLARQFLRRPRSSSVFSAPVRQILGAESQADASRLHRAVDGRGFGVQGYAILPKIREWDELLRVDSHARTIVREVHPEVSFAAMRKGRGIEAPKKSQAGREVRKGLLGSIFGAGPIEDLLRDRPIGVAIDDLLDAAAALWSASRICNGTAISLPERPTIDSNGLTTAIWY